MHDKRLKEIFEKYIENFEKLNAEPYDEGYKWRAVSQFRKCWDPDTEDFPGMFKESMCETYNLIDNGTVNPVSGINSLLKHDDEIEFVRNCFSELFSDDGGDLDERQGRVNDFIEKINTRLDIHYSGQWKNKQLASNVICFLNLWRPEDNYIYKPTEAKEWANCIEFGDDFGGGSTFSLKKYYRMCDELLDEVSKNSEILRLNEQRFRKNAVGYDDKLHILVYDIIYCSQAYNFYTGMNILNVSARQRITNARNRERIDHLNILIAENDEKITELINKKAELPDITGREVMHKKFGMGTAIMLEDANDGTKRLVVDINGKQMKFAYPMSLQQGLLSCDSVDISIFKNNADIEQEIKNLQNDIADARDELKKLGVLER